MRSPASPAAKTEVSFVDRSVIAQGLFYISAPSRGLTLVAMVLFAMDALACVVARMQPLTVALVIAAAALRAVVRGFLRPGYLRTLDAERRGVKPAADELISGTRDFDKAIVTHVASDLVIALSLLIGALPGLLLLAFAVNYGHPDVVAPALALAATGSFALYLYAYLGVRFGEHVVVFEKLGPFAAVSRSWELARGNRLRILWVLWVAATLELLGLVWGIATFGFGIFVGVPYARLAGDHATLGLFAQLQDEARKRAALGGAAPYVGFGRILAVRGVTMPEYALILAAIVLVAGTAYRALGRAAGNNANRASSVLAANGTAGGGGAGGAGGAAAGAGGPGGVAGFFSDVVEGLVKGDFSDKQTIGKAVGQVVGSFIPIYGQIAAIRDAGAAVRDIAEGKKGGYVNLGLAAVGFIPGIGTAAKVGAKGAREAAAVAHAGEEVAKEGGVVKAIVGAAKKNSKEFEEGGFSLVHREGDNVIKEIKGEVNAAGGGKISLDAAERKELAQEMAEFHNEVAANPKLGGVVPPVEVVGDGVLKQKAVDGLTLKDIQRDHPEVFEKARDAAQGKINRAEEGLGLDRGGGTGKLANGWVVKIDDNGANFRFDKEGNVTSWFDPVAVFPCRGAGCH